eukprot:scaffold29905_cov64-Phaeocystis_antarctica.AAC.15
MKAPRAAGGWLALLRKTTTIYMLPVTTCWRARSVRSAKRLTGCHSRVRRAGTNRFTCEAGGD